MRFKKILAPSMLILFSGALLIQLPIAIADRASNYDLFDPVIDVRHLLVEGFVDQAKLDDKQMQLAMINGMIETLDDPHTVFVPPDEHAEFEKDIRGSYVGIGCEVNIIDDYLTIISPMDGSPALEAGIMAGDVVLEIEGQSTLKMPIQDCIAKLMGEPGTPVTIKVRHLDGTEQPYTIVRSRITTRTVRGLRRQGEDWNYCIDDQLGLSYIRVTQFNATTIDELTGALDNIQQRALNGLILDLRDNGGGEFEAAVQLADLFLDEGTIVSVRPREGRGEIKTFAAHLAGTLPDFPMLVLVNERSASASEIVAGALQENHRAKILGTRTFGKGSVQEIRELDYNRGTLKFTSAHYYIGGADGRNIHRSSDSQVWGVDPDPGMVMPVPDEDYIEMFRARREFEIIRNGKDNGPACANAQWIADNLKDRQLARAVEVLATAVRTGDWPQVSQEQSAVVAFDQELNRALEQRIGLIEATMKIEERIAALQKLSTQAGKPPLL
ncbi:MAG: S41 family peptidase, partial [Phycisphaerales bacterium]|nr:S41 family peptidase [Phycisphaerales bacterium]